MDKLPVRGFRDHLPGSRILVTVAIAGGILLLGTALAVAYALSYPAGERLGQFGFTEGWMVVPLVALIIQVTAWLEKRYVPKAALGCGSVVLLFVSALLGFLGFSTSAETGSIASGAALLCYGPFVLVFSVVAVYGLIKAPAEWRQATTARQSERALELIELREGEVTYQELAAELNSSKGEVDQLLSDLIEAERLQGYRRPSHGLFFTEKGYVEKQSRLAGVLKSHGQISVDELAYELDVPSGLVRELIDALVRRGRFTGYINWDEELVYSAEARELTEKGACPKCGGELGLAGKGVIRCQNCGTEVFLGG